jgi:tetratricopeptide (TPR) repeat protein
MWRGTKDDIDTDEWIDLVEDEQLARSLNQVDQLLNECSGNPNQQEMRKRAWDLLEGIPECHQYHVEVLRRRLQRFCCHEDFQDHASAVRWARKLVEAEPYDVINWWSLSWAVEKLEGKSASVEVLRKALEHHGPDFTLYSELASHLCALNRLDEAKEAMLLALKADPCAMDSAQKSESFAPIREFIREQMESDWYQRAEVLL